MSMRVHQDRFGEILSLEATASHAWRRWLGRYFLFGVVVVGIVLAILLLRDPAIGWITKTILLTFGTLLALLLMVVIEHVLRPRSGCVELGFDRDSDEARLTPHAVLRKAKAIAIPLSDIAEIRIRATGLPSFSLGGLLAAARAASQEGELDKETFERDALTSAPLEFRLALFLEDAEERHQKREVTLAVETVTGELGAVILASRIAAACGLGYQSVYSLPKVGVEVHLTPVETPTSEPVPNTEKDLAVVAEEMLQAAGPPPFDASTLAADHQVTEWSPGRMVRFERNPSRARFLALPFTVLVMVGPALWLYAATHDKQINPVGFGVLSGLGLLVGVIAIAIVRIPARRIEFDWERRAMLLTRRSKCTTLPFDALGHLELEGIAHESSGGESGGTTMSYWCKLKAIPAADSGNSAKPIELISTRSTSRPDEPWRQASPLLLELAGALGVEGRTTGYGR